MNNKRKMKKKKQQTTTTTTTKNQGLRLYGYKMRTITIPTQTGL
jgi:hypothetical protein